MILTPWTTSLIAEGRVSYNESLGAWNTIRLSKDIIKEFPTLKNRKAKISFKIEYSRTMENLRSTITQTEKENKGIPMLLYIYLDEPIE